MQIKREIEVLRRGFTAPIDMTYGTDLIKIVLAIKDFEIPKNATVIVYAEKAGKQVKKIFAELEGNTIAFTPEKEFFEVGKNSLQVRVVHEEKSLFSFAIDVNCQKSHLNDDAEEVEAQPTLVEQLIAKMSKHTYNGIFTGKVDKSDLGEHYVRSYNTTNGQKLTLDDLIIDGDGKMYVVARVEDKIYLEYTGICITGSKGDKGDDGYTPQKGVDYTDGKDGIDGANGKDGVSIISVSIKEVQ